METTEVLRWTHNGHECAIHWKEIFRGGHYCGYVQTTLDPERDPLDIPVEVHGGITWGIDADGWIGFDCAHAGDVCISPHGVRSSELPGLTRREWTLTDVQDETESLADQLAELETDDETR